MALACLPALSACESFYEAEAVRTHPAPGKLVDIGSGRRIQIECQGEGGPTVVFQAGGDTLGSLGWKPVAGADGLAFERENERLTIGVREPASNKPAQVRFELIVKLASTRLPE